MHYDLQALLGENKEHYQGLNDAVVKNIEACKELSAITKTSMGPNGMNKAIINHLEKLTITSNTATIVSELEVIHPAAKLLVLAATAQQREIGDGTNQVITLAGELLGQAEQLIRDGLHPTDIIKGYRRATDKAMEVLTSLVFPGSESFDHRNENCVIQKIKGTVVSKYFGNEDFICRLIARACIYTCPCDPSDFRTENIKVVKIIGGGLDDSIVVKGFIMTRDTENSVKEVVDAKVVVYTSGLDTATTETKSSLLLRNADDLLAYSKREEMQMNKVIEDIVNSGAKVVVVGSSIGETASYFLEKYGLMVIQILSKFEMKRFCQVTGCCALSKPVPPTTRELGSVTAIRVKEIGNTKCIVVEQDPKKVTVATIVLRCSIPSIINDVEHAIENGISAYKTLSMDSRTVPAGGSTEIQIASRLMDFAQREFSVEQFAIQKYAEALEIIPRTLAENSGLSVTKAVSNLWSAHSSGNKTAGLDIENGETKDLFKEDIVDIYATKWWSFKLLCDAVNTILQVDHIIMAKKAGGPATKPEVDEIH